MDNSKPNPKDPAMWHVHCLHAYSQEIGTLMSAVQVLVALTAGGAALVEVVKSARRGYLR